MTSFKSFVCVVLAASIASTLLAETHCPGNVGSLAFRLVKGHKIVLRVTMNHSGPYEFVLDTGSDMTVVGTALADELHLIRESEAAVTGAGFHDAASVAQVDLMEAGSQSVAKQKVLVYGGMKLGSIDPNIRGILGEDFLEHFDLLVDSAHPLVCLDDSGVMRAAMKGPHIPLVEAVPVAEGASPRRLLVVTARLTEQTLPVRLKLDSGSDMPVLYGFGQRMAQRSFGDAVSYVSGANGSREIFAALPPQDVTVGPSRLPRITFYTIADGRRDSRREDFDGLLPMSLFRRAFICHAEHYAVLETW
jgi:hypothetical protein